MVALGSSVALAVLQFGPILSDPDSFYHAGLTIWLRDYGLLKYFPWTQYSFYNQIFIDHHFGYHLLLIPFVSLWEPLVGIKIATWFFGSLTLAGFWWLIKTWCPPYWGYLVPVVLAASPFLVRLSLAKAPVLSVGFLLLGYYLISQRKSGWFFGLAWAFVWFYSAWPLLFVMLAVFTVGGYFYDRFFLKKTWLDSITKGGYKSLWLSLLFGTLVGLVINPYFPQNFLYLKQLFDMALRPYHSFLAIGAEWYPFPWLDLVATNTFVVGLWLLATLVAIFNRSNIKKQTFITWLLASLFLVYTLRARRQVEYMTPFMILSAGLIIKDSWSQILDWATHRLEFLPNFLTSRLFGFFLVTYLSIALPLGVLIGYGRAYLSLHRGFGSDNLKPVAGWLKNNTPPNSLVWQTDWGTFPLLWYHNSHNYYLTGLDQTFMYAFSPDLYNKWRSLTTGQKRDDAYDVIKNDFKADYVLLEKRFPALLYSLNRDNRFVREYQDKEVIIFSVN